MTRQSTHFNHHPNSSLGKNMLPLWTEDSTRKDPSLIAIDCIDYARIPHRTDSKWTWNGRAARQCLVRNRGLTGLIRWDGETSGLIGLWNNQYTRGPTTYIQHILWKHVAIRKFHWLGEYLSINQHTETIGLEWIGSVIRVLAPAQR